MISSLYPDMYRFFEPRIFEPLAVGGRCVGQQQKLNPKGLPSKIIQTPVKHISKTFQALSKIVQQHFH